MKHREGRPNSSSVTKDDVRTFSISRALGLWLSCFVVFLLYTWGYVRWANPAMPSVRQHAAFALITSASWIAIILLSARTRTDEETLAFFHVKLPTLRACCATVVVLWSCALLQWAVALVWWSAHIEWPKIVKVALFIPSACCEELLYRGVMLPAFRQRWRFVPAVLVIWILFAISHLHFALSITWLFSMLLFTYALCWVREKYDSVVNCVLGHWIYNVGLSFIAYRDNM